MKIIVGIIFIAKMKLLPKIDVNKSGLSARKPKTKRPPSSEKSSNFFIKYPIPSKIAFPKDVFKIKTARNNCNPRPTNTVLKLIAFLLFDIKNAIPRIKTIPINPKKRSTRNSSKVFYTPILLKNIFFMCVC